MSLSLPRTRKSDRSLAFTLACSVNLGLAYVLVHLISVNASISEQQASHAYFVETLKEKQEPEIEIRRPIVTSHAPTSAAKQPAVVNFEIATFETTITLPEVVFSPSEDTLKDLSFDFSLSTGRVGAGSIAQSTIAMAKPSYQIPPKYPLKAKRKGIEGFITLELLINDKGKPEQYRVVTEQPKGVFLQSAVRSVMRWRFFPPKSGREWQRLVLNYTLKD